MKTQHSHKSITNKYFKNAKKEKSLLQPDSASCLLKQFPKDSLDTEGSYLLPMETVHW